MYYTIPILGYNVHNVFYFDLARLDHLIGEIRCIPERQNADECIFKVTIGRSLRSITFEKFVEFLLVACKRFFVDIRNGDLETMFYDKGLKEEFERRTDGNEEEENKRQERLT